MFVDLDWPLNASSLLSASAELLVSLTLPNDIRRNYDQLRRTFCDHGQISRCHALTIESWTVVQFMQTWSIAQSTELDPHSMPLLYTHFHFRWAVWAKHTVQGCFQWRTEHWARDLSAATDYYIEVCTGVGTKRIPWNSHEKGSNGWFFVGMRKEMGMV